MLRHRADDNQRLVVYNALSGNVLRHRTDDRGCVRVLAACVSGEAPAAAIAIGLLRLFSRDKKTLAVLVEMKNSVKARLRSKKVKENENDGEQL